MHIYTRASSLLVSLLRIPPKCSDGLSGPDSINRIFHTRVALKELRLCAQPSNSLSSPLNGFLLYSALDKHMSLALC